MISRYNDGKFYSERELMLENSESKSNHLILIWIIFFVLNISLIYFKNLRDFAYSFFKFCTFLWLTYYSNECCLVLSSEIQRSLQFVCGYKECEKSRNQIQQKRATSWPSLIASFSMVFIQSWWLCISSNTFIKIS